MSKLTGVVTKIHSKPTRTGGVAYSTLIGEVWYGAGFDAPLFKEGDNIEFNVPEGKYKNLADVVVVKASDNHLDEAAGEVAKHYNRGSNSTQTSIVAQSALKAGIDFTKLLLANDLVKLGKKDSAKVEIVEEIVRKYQRQFFDDNMLAIKDLDAWHGGAVEEAPGPNGEGYDG